MTPSRDSELDCLLALACTALDVPHAVLAPADGREIRFGASDAADRDLFACEPAFRKHVPASQPFLAVPDAALDDRFAPHLPGGADAGIRFYAGMRLAEPGLALGTLSLFGRRPRAFTRAAQKAVARIAGLMTAILRQHRDAWMVERLTRALQDQGDALSHTKKIFDRSSEIAKIGVWECDLARDDSLRWTDGVYDLFELPRGSPIDRARTVALYFPESRAEMERLRAKAIRERGGFTLDARIRTARGNERWMRLTADVESENGVAVRLFGMKQDITEEKALWERTRFLAEIDVMTGLANRSLFQATLSRLGPDGGPSAVGALLLIDLDGFKQINDTFGHALGDECLKQVATRLRDACRDAELVARIGGDEFAVLLRAPIDRPEVEALADLILDELRRPVRRGEHSFQLGASVGIALPHGGAACDPADLFVHADIALYAAKAAGKNTFRIFDPRMKSEGDRRFETVRETASALAEGRLDLYYQPKIRLADGRLAGFEALLRRRMPDGRVIAAGAFKAALEEPELSLRLGAWVIDAALRQAGLWHRAGLDFGNVAINLSAAQLHDHRLADKLIERIAEHGLKPETIEVEVTENVFLGSEPGPVKRMLERLKRSGMRVALDDFGTGYASLVHLRTYPVDVIKIDRSFVQAIQASAQDRAVLETLLRLGSSLGLEVVAEGIETTDQLDELKAMGCPLGQGFLFSRAVPAVEAVAWLTPEASPRAQVA